MPQAQSAAQPSPPPRNQGTSQPEIPELDLTPQDGAAKPVKVLPQDDFKPPPAITFTTDEGTTPTSRELVREFRRINDELERIAELDTDVKKDAEHQEMVERLNARISKRTNAYTFNFKVENVLPIANGKSTVKLEAPEEAQCFAVAKGLPQIEIYGWSEKQLFAIRKGDTIQVTGVPFVTTKGNLPSNNVIAMTIFAPRFDTGYRIHVINYKIEHVKRRGR